MDSADILGLLAKFESDLALLGIVSSIIRIGKYGRMGQES